jgi:glycogen operon protein
LTGSPDLYDRNGRQASASINFVTAHDGFTLHDLVSYKSKHNEANGENNTDGSAFNHSTNHGVEGPTDDSEILSLRLRQQKNLLATLLLSAGVPMLTAGDERDRTQLGNNNAYNQDNEISWINWSETESAKTLTELVAKIVEIRRSFPMIQGAVFPGKVPPSPRDRSAITWFRPDGHVMTSADWSGMQQRALTLRMSLDADGAPAPGLRELLVLFNSSDQNVDFSLPSTRTVRGEWELLVETGACAFLPEQPSDEDPTAVLLPSSLVVLGCTMPEM